VFEAPPERGFFRAVQLEFGFLLGPADGRYLIRDAPDAQPVRIVVLRTLGAPQRRLMDRRRRRPRTAKHGDPAPVPTARAGVVAAEPIGSEDEASAWLGRLRADRELLEREVADAVATLNRFMRAHRAAASDPYARDLRPEAAMVVRVGHGTGEQVAAGRFTKALEVPTGASRRKRRIERLTPQERLAAIVGGRQPVLASDDLVLRARVDLDAGRPREAALQSRIALESVLEELAGELGELGAELADDRDAVSAAATEALSSEPRPELVARVEGAVGRMEKALRRHRSA
jgi:hypothetical protein